MFFLCYYAEEDEEDEDGGEEEVAVRTASLRYHPDGDALSRLRAIGAYAYTVSQGECTTEHNITFQIHASHSCIPCAVLLFLDIALWCSVLHARCSAA